MTGRLICGQIKLRLEISIEQHVAKLRERADGSLNLHAQQSALPDIDEKVGHVLCRQVFAETSLLLSAGQSLVQLVAITAHGVAQRRLAEVAGVADFAHEIAEQTAALEIAPLGFLDQLVEIGFQRRFGVDVRCAANDRRVE